MEESSKMNARMEPEKVAIGLSQKSPALNSIDHEDFGSARSKILAIQGKRGLVMDKRKTLQSLLILQQVSWSNVY